MCDLLDIQNWEVSETCEFLKRNVDEVYYRNFKNKRIDGLTLALLPWDDYSNFIPDEKKGRKVQIDRVEERRKIFWAVDAKVKEYVKKILSLPIKSWGVIDVCLYARSINEERMLEYCRNNKIDGILLLKMSDQDMGSNFMLCDSVKRLQFSTFFMKMRQRDSQQDNKIEAPPSYEK